MVSDVETVLDGLSAAFKANFTDFPIVLDGHWQKIVIEFGHKYWNIVSDFTVKHLIERLTTEVVACGLCAGGALWLLKRLVLSHPRTVKSFLAVWICWFVTDMSIGRGAAVAYHDIQLRGAQTFDASRDLAKSLVKFVTSWLHFLMPFMVDAFHLGCTLWNKLTPQQRFLLFFAALAVYAVIETFRAARRAAGRVAGKAANKARGAKRAMKKVMFQASFLVFGPVLWFASALVPVNWLPWLVSGVVSLIPCLTSYAAVCYNLEDETGVPDADTTRTTRSLSVLPRLPMTEAERRKMWLSYWACWPVLKASELGIGWLPWLIPGYSSILGDLQVSDLQRAMLVLVTWLQFWQGSRLLNFTLRSTLGRFNGVVITIPVGKIRKRAQQASAGELQPSMRTMGKIAQFTAKLGQYRKLWKLGAALLLIGFGVLAWLFYRAFRFLSDTLTVLTWCFAAADTADLLFKGAEDFYSKRLSFWVLAMVWDAATRLPVVGAAMSIFNPVVFSIFYIAGDKVIRWFLIPVSSRLEAILRVALKPIVAIVPSMPSLRRAGTGTEVAETEDEGDDDEGDSEGEAEVEDNGNGGPSASSEQVESGTATQKNDEAKDEKKEEAPKGNGNDESKAPVDKHKSKAPEDNGKDKSKVPEEEGNGKDKSQAEEVEDESEATPPITDLGETNCTVDGNSPEDDGLRSRKGSGKKAPKNGNKK